MSLARTRLISASLTGAERHALDLAASSARAINANADLMREGEAADQIYAVIHGWGCRYKTTRDGHRQIVGVLIPGDVANLETLMFDHAGYGVRMLRASTVVPISRERLTALASKHSGINHMLVRLALVENAILSQWALCLGRRSARQRLAHLLCEMAVRVGAAEGGSARNFELPLTQEQLADLLGLTPVHVNRTIQQLRTDGLIVTGSRFVNIPDMAWLRDTAEFDPAYLHMEDRQTATRQERSEFDSRVGPLLSPHVS